MTSGQTDTETGNQTLRHSILTPREVKSIRVRSVKAEGKPLGKWAEGQRISCVTRNKGNKKKLLHRSLIALKEVSLFRKIKGSLASK